jgi:hypothetical protein
MARRLTPSLLALAVLSLLALAGCVANDDNAMPWATPDPNESSVNLPFTRP